MAGKGIGENIAIYRKLRGLTQEELGKSIGITTQAVSRWECGGTPDVVLLPAIADRLGVTIDSLFGREGGETINLEELIFNRMAAMPRDQRLDYMGELVWTALKGLIGVEGVKDVKYIDHAIERIALDKNPVWMRSCAIIDEGFVLGVPAKDFQFWSIIPEPKGGFEAFLGANEEYAALFNTLGKPGRFLVLRFFYQNEENYYIASTIAKRLSLDIEVAEEILRDLADIGLIKGKKLELEDRTIAAYIVHCNGAFIPFLILAKWLMEPYDSWHLGWDPRTAPYLKQEDSKNE